ncbi:MAG: ATP-dependent zinc metalloprotease FtsH, partial [Oscillospiraceae bacterium]|nr:ATP-dependent zinc metalloprotease FtsH [Oscillospiraceae bacterium]
MKKQRNNSIGFILLILLGVVVIAVLLSGNMTRTATVKYSEVLNLFKTNQVSEFLLDLNNGKLTMVLRDAAPSGGAAEIGSPGASSQANSQAPGAQGESDTQRNDNAALGEYLFGQSGATGKRMEYTVPYMGLFLEQVIPMVDAYNAEHPETFINYDFIQASNNTMWYNIGMLVVMALLLGGFWFLMTRQAGGGKIMNVGKAKVKDQAGERNPKTFADVAGADEEKEELQEIVEFLKDPGKFSVLGARIPRGVLLVGPPGTGKTLLAKACAGEAGVPFYSISGSDFVEMYVGVGASRVRDLFDKAKKTAPSIVFIDEIDAVGRQRGTGLGGGHDEREQTLNQLLVEMDGFGVNEGVIVIAATNRADILDHALLRPGRFDRQVYVGRPDVKGREEILKVHTRNKPLGPDVELSTVAKSTAGFTGADLENLVNEAALSAAKKGRKAIMEKDIEEASVKVQVGTEKKSRVVTEEEKRLTAYHEAGHAITSYYSNTSDPVHQISIIPRGMAGGYTMYLPEKDDSFITKTKMQEDIISLLGGRVAEKLVLDDISTGASNDLERATQTARSMVMRYGFSDRLGPVVYGSDPQETFLGRDYASGRTYSETVAAEIDEEIRDLLDEAYETASRLLSDHMDQLHKVAAALMEREKVSGEEFKTLMEGGELPPFELEDTKKASDSKKEEPSGKKAETGAE